MFTNDIDAVEFGSSDMYRQPSETPCLYLKKNAGAAGGAHQFSLRTVATSILRKWKNMSLTNNLVMLEALTT